MIDKYLVLAKDISDWVAIAQFLLQRGQFLQLTGKPSDAEKALSESLEAIKKVENEKDQDHLRAMVLNSLGGVFQKQGNFKEAVDALQQSYEYLIKLNDELGQAKVLNSLSGVFQRQGNFNEAAKALQKSADIEEKLGNERGQAMILNSLGGVLQRQGNFDKAVESLQKSEKIEEKIGNQHGRAKVLNSLGGVFQRQGKFDVALDAFQKSYSLLFRLTEIDLQLVV